MGLDFVECIMELEDEFGITIPSNAFEPVFRAGRDLTAQDVTDVVLDLLKHKQIAPPVDLWPRIQKIMASYTRLEVGQITPQSRLVKDLGFD